jgi:hypothetical protein
MQEFFFPCNLKADVQKSWNDTCQKHTINVQWIALTLIVTRYKKVIDSGFWKTPYTIILLESSYEYLKILKH